MNDICASLIKRTNDLINEIDVRHIFLISDAIHSNITLTAPMTFIHTSSLAGELQDELKEILSADAVQSLQYNVAIPALKNFEMVKDLTTLAYITDVVQTGYVLGIVCLKSLSSIIVLDVKQLVTVKTIDQSGGRVDASSLKAILSLALELGREGREGKRVGTAFIIGDTDQVLRRSHQLILNPFEGHPREARDIKNKAHWETVKEFAQIDGVFIVDEDGIIISAGRYLDVDTKSVGLEGLGGRHISASAITRDTQAIAITVSESGGAVRIFKDGIETKIELSADLICLLP